MFKLLIFSSLGHALAAGFESWIEGRPEPQKLNVLCVQMCRLLYRVNKTHSGLVTLLQMCLVNVVNQLFERSVENLGSRIQNDLETTEASNRSPCDVIGIDKNATWEVDVKMLLTSLLTLPICDAKTLCLTKIQILMEATP